MSVWHNIAERKPPLYEDVLILYKHREDDLEEKNLYYGISHRLESYFNGECRWAYYIQYQGCYEVVYWTPLVDMPRIKERIL